MVPDGKSHCEGKGHDAGRKSNCVGISHCLGKGHGVGRKSLYVGTKGHGAGRKSHCVRKAHGAGRTSHCVGLTSLHLNETPWRGKEKYLRGNEKSFHRKKILYVGKTVIEWNRKVIVRLMNSHAWRKKSLRCNEKSFSEENVSAWERKTNCIKRKAVAWERKVMAWKQKSLRGKERIGMRTKSQFVGTTGHYT